MSILAALNGYYDRLADAGKVPPYGYTTERVSFCFVLSEGGDLVEVADLRSDGKTARPLPVPQAIKRTGPVPKSFFLWDNAKFVLGLTVDKATKRVAEAPKHREAFAAYHRAVLAKADDAGLLALIGFLDHGQAAVLEQPERIKSALDGNIVFALDGDRGPDGQFRYLHDRPAARDIWARKVDEAAGNEGTCLITGHTAPIARIHPSIKGVWGAQSSGASVVSFNADSFESYGARQGANAPISEAAAAAYGAALNAMLARDSGHQMQIGDATTVFWADASGVGETSAVAAETALMAFFAPDNPDSDEEAAKIRAVLCDVARGRAIRELSPGVDPATRCYMLGLSPAVSRLIIRSWAADSFDHFARHIEQHWRDLYIEPYPWRTGPAAWALLHQTAVLGKSENIQPLLGGELIRAILTGQRYPRTLLSATVARIRADGQINGQRAAIIKACLQREARLSGTKEEIPVSLDRDDPNPAYRLGRLFAVLENVQRAALGSKVNATIRDKFFSSASATPASIFPVLMRNATNHLASLRRNGGNAWAEIEIAQILETFGSGLPRSLRIEDQGRFVIGYYHQRQSQFAPKSAADKTTITATTEAIETEE